TISNAIIAFNNNSSLVVNGNLNANGATFDFISGNSTYTNGIKLLAGSTATISTSTIKNAYQGINLNQACLNLSNSEIMGCSSHGVYMYDERSVANRSEIYGCNIHDNTGTGIVLYYSSPIIQVNNIYNNYYGMGVSDYSAPSLGYMGAYGYNHIYSNRSHGFSANRNSNPFLGENICITNGGHNKIDYNKGYNLSVYGNSIVTAENNWWEYLTDNVTINTARFYVSSGSFVYYPPADPTDPLRWMGDPNIVSGSPLAQSSPEEKLFDKKFVASTGAVSKGGINESQIASMGKDSLEATAELKTPTGYDEKWPILKKLTFAKYLLLLNRDTESSQICKKIVESIPDSSLSYYALDILWQNGRKNRMEDFKDYLKLLKSSLDKKPAGLMAEVIETRFDRENRIKLLCELWAKIKSSELKDLSPKAKKDIQESILFSKLLHYINDEKNMEKAKETVLEVDDLVGSGSHSSVEAHGLVGDIVPEKEILVKEMKDSEESAKIEKPTEYSLSGNYPNPFNPSTRIDYSLPMTSKVELKVYDILGHEVATLVNTIQEAGRYSAMFNASNVSSGLYIYKISAHSLENGRVFEKTAKMMFLK
ncbi:MAG: T9SS type A sorting domain-containing protein, partial [Ignavibacteria bacterium]|nr:T9SS type A sorting domain-containing protein [Ignavibacteria bacterium]